MRLRERSQIDRPAAVVWPYVIRSEFFQKWNTKISSMDVTGEFQLGQPFTTHYLWKGRPLQCVSRATEIQVAACWSCGTRSRRGPASGRT